LDIETIAGLPFFAGRRYPKPDLIGRCRQGRIESTSGRELVEQVRDLSLGLSAIGMRPGDRVGLLSESRPEWIFADLAVLVAGGVTTPIYPTLSADQVAFILRDSGARLAIVSTASLFQKIVAVAAGLPALESVIVMDDAAESRPPQGAAWSVHALADIVAAGHRRILGGWGVAREFEQAAMAVRPGDLATIVYTSGTTGDPKGVRLTHGNLASNVRGVQGVLDLHEGDIALSFLPLCHAFERLVSYVYLACGVSVVFAESFDTVARDLLVVRPTVMSGVPRAFEKLHARVLAKGREETGIMRRVFELSMRVADARGRVLSEGRPMPAWLSLQSRVADRLVFSRIREGIGGRGRFFVSGSAPLRAETLRFFRGVGLPLLEGYGLTEASPVISVCALSDTHPGSVGRPLPGVEVRIAADGEILARGPNIMEGYHGRPADTAEVLRDGWLHTGDIGSVDADGYLTVTDRKKELLVTSGGKKIAPQPIEAALRRDAIVADALLVGDGRHFLSALIVPNVKEVCSVIGVPVPEGLAATQALVDRADVRAKFQALVDAVNAPLAPFERIKQFVLLPRDFSTDPGAITPTLKVKRRVVETTYREVIETMYGQRVNG
jgi:long-chain acyl-CoA synthetase